MTDKKIKRIPHGVANYERVAQLKAEGEKQLKNYSIDDKFKKTIGKTKLIKILLIFSGHKLLDMGEVK